MSSSTPPTQVLSPSRLAHVVLRTNNFERMTTFYLRFLGGRVAWRSDHFAFITYDDEHHRLALVNMPNIADKKPESCGLEHVAFGFDSLRGLCDAYRQRKALGMTPGWCVNHGATTSMYYRDPDGNTLETQADNLADPAAVNAYIDSEAFRKNPLGADFDPDELCRLLDSGEFTEEELKQPKDVGPRDPRTDLPIIMEKFGTATVGV